MLTSHEPRCSYAVEGEEWDDALENSRGEEGPPRGEEEIEWILKLFIDLHYMFINITRIAEMMIAWSKLINNLCEPSIMMFHEAINWEIAERVRS